jgi:hypothetical protein
MILSPAIPAIDIELEGRCHGTAPLDMSTTTERCRLGEIGCGSPLQNAAFFPMYTLVVAILGNYFMRWLFRFYDRLVSA